jgi:hypothetical protein
VWQHFRELILELCRKTRNPIFDGAAEPRHQKLGSLLDYKTLRHWKRQNRFFESLPTAGFQKNDFYNENC